MASGENESSTARIIAVPVAGELLSMHFGHCEAFELFGVDTESKEVLNSRRADSPPHEPGVLPQWLHEQGTNMIIAGGMGCRAQQLFQQAGIEVIIGAPAQSPQSLVQAWLDGNLQSGENLCDH